MIVRVLTEFAALLGLGGKPIRFSANMIQRDFASTQTSLKYPPAPPTFLGPGGKFTRFSLT